MFYENIVALILGIVSGLAIVYGKGRNMIDFCINHPILVTIVIVVQLIIPVCYVNYMYHKNQND